jgi:hypothetical protein
MNDILQFYHTGNGGGKVIRSIKKAYEHCRNQNQNINYIAQDGKGRTVGYESMPDYYREYLGFYCVGAAVYSLPAAIQWSNIPKYRRIYPPPESYDQIDNKLP